ncbi:response regulator, partial [Phytoactinopolyspora endophytica]|uniref:response regulator transcription factor n=1 Tax=Phytoactinopolyspora endophytica TaxID=1642495 RepID=UPI00197C2907
RQGLRRAFERDSEFQVVGEAASVGDARRLAETTQPDVAVLDVRLPDGSGLDLAQSLRSARPDVGLVILTMYAGDDQLFAALDAGASAFVPKSAPSDDVVAAARHAAAKPSSFIAADLAEAMHRKLNPSGPQLTRREREVLGLLAEGLGVSSISRKLYISESTTKTHVSKLYDKLGAGNRAQAIMAAVRAGLLDNTTEP